MKFALAVTRSLLAGAVVLGTAGLSGSAIAAQEDLDLLYSYIGDWRGRGTATYRDSGDRESVFCHMTLERAAAGKVSFVGNCTMAGGGVQISGTVGYSDQNRRYEARATSASYTGQAIGRRTSSGIQFTMVQFSGDEGPSYEIDLGLALNDEAISVDFGVLNPEDGWGMDADVPFSRR